MNADEKADCAAQPTTDRSECERQKAGTRPLCPQISKTRKVKTRVWMDFSSQVIDSDARIA